MSAFEFNHHKRVELNSRLLKFWNKMWKITNPTAALFPLGVGGMWYVVSGKEFSFFCLPNSRLTWEENTGIPPRGI